MVFCVHGNKWGMAQCCEELSFSEDTHCHEVSFFHFILRHDSEILEKSIFPKSTTIHISLAHQCKEFSTQGDCTVTIIGWTFSKQPIPAQYWQGKSTLFPDHPVHWSSQFGRLGTKLGREYSIP